MKILQLFIITIILTTSIETNGSGHKNKNFFTVLCEQTFFDHINNIAYTTQERSDKSYAVIVNTALYKSLCINYPDQTKHMVVCSCQSNNRWQNESWTIEQNNTITASKNWSSHKAPNLKKYKNN